MSPAILNEVTLALKLAVFQRDRQGRLNAVGRAPEWVATLWPQFARDGGVLRPETSSFLENFLIDAGAVWKAAGDRRVDSGPWVERDPAGNEHSLHATALTAAGRAVLLVEEMGSVFAERSSLLQRAHEAALAFENLQRTEQALEEKKKWLEERVRERTAELSQANAALRDEIAVRRRYAERLEAVREIDRAILAVQSPQAIAEAALRRLRPLLPCEQASVVALEPDTGRATVLARLHEGVTVPVEAWQLSAAQLEGARVLQSGKLHRIHNRPNLFGPDAMDPAAAAWPLIVDVPLVTEDTLVGVLNLATRSSELFTAEHEEIAGEIAAQLAVALRQARLFAEITAGREQLRALSLRLVEVQETERRFMAHELHDEIGQLLTGLKLTLELPGHERSEPPDANVREALALVDELIGRVRQLSLDLRPQVLDDLGLLPALDWLFKRFHGQTGIGIQFKHTPELGRLASQLETAAFRIVQEALTNIARHSGVREATVRVWLDETSLGVQIEDNGAGFDAGLALTPGSSSGLAGMRERALMLGGEFSLDSKPGKGTRVTVELPISVTGRPVTAREGGAK